ncbi:hypothetical protein CMU34_10930 [Elizabethkingia anophelis]|jgi:hypothetical protein|uniref:RNA polymerase sigma-70 region 4 domain-containing protein n=1 Tax=Chryseobacterium indologenes TaxID=253 RepID=A0A0N1KTW8_CHRID|nr:hypothetical protein [Chryseobacterium indologenes]KPE52545.1 hypothetical protein AOB46_00520 [Chryseobacterium indologenes]MDV3734006.1 hypothetical protein [Elizabethkingia anophelis]
MPINRQIARTNEFYLEISKRILTEKEYNILRRLLIDNQSINEVAQEYNLSTARIRQIFNSTFDKAKSIADTFQDIAYYKQKLYELRTAYLNEKNKKIASDTPLLSNPELLSMKIMDSHFPFSKRLYNMLEIMEVVTISDLQEISLEKLHHFSGFGRECKRELIAFIEFEDLENYFEGFYKWKQSKI